jgi:hypothetical protein
MCATHVHVGSTRLRRRGDVAKRREAAVRIAAVDVAKGREPTLRKMARDAGLDIKRSLQVAGSGAAN